MRKHHHSFIILLFLFRVGCHSVIAVCVRVCLCLTVLHDRALTPGVAILHVLPPSSSGHTHTVYMSIYIKQRPTKK